MIGDGFMLTLKNIKVMTKENALILNDISMTLNQGKIIGLTGESGAGKSSIIKVIMGFLDKGCRLSQGEIYVDDLKLNDLSNKEKRSLCGTTIGFVPQNPMTAFDNRIKIGAQMEETFCIRLGLSKQEARELAVEKLKLVNLDEYEHVLSSVPMELSGGMLQRVAFAILLGLEPRYVLADEPTSALDEKNRDLILDLLEKQKKASGILFISHDLVALDRLCETVVILDKGKIIDNTTVEKLIKAPKHSWLKEFVKSNRSVDIGEWQWKEF